MKHRPQKENKHSVEGVVANSLQDTPLPSALAEAGSTALAARPRRQRTEGLSSVHNRPQFLSPEWQVNLYEGGSLVEIKAPKRVGWDNGGKRGLVTAFSRASRQRLMRHLAKTKADELPIFGTLTYPDIFPENPRVWKSDLKAFFKRLKRVHPESSGFWKMELKPRLSGENEGQVAPHLHLLLWGVPWTWLDANGCQRHWEFEFQYAGLAVNGKRLVREEIWINGALKSARFPLGAECAHLVKGCESTRSVRRKWGREVCRVEFWINDGVPHLDRAINRLRKSGHIRDGLWEVRLHEWLSLAWYEVVGSGDLRHLRAGTNCQEIKSHKGVMHYASKYICKIDSQAVGAVGRYWGTYNVQAIPWADLVNVKLGGEEAFRLMRAARRYVWAEQRRKDKARKIRWRSNCGMAFFCDSSFWLQRLQRLAGKASA